MSGVIMATRNNSNATADCNELYQEAKKFLASSQKLLSKLESHLLDLTNTKARQEALLSPTNVGRLKALHNFQPLLDETRTTVNKMAGLEKRFLGKCARAI